MTDSWKAFEQNPITHSAAHHLVAISELLEEFGYARVSDVARSLKITRGSVSVTLKNLKQRGLVTEDERRFLGLSETGRRIAGAVQAKKLVMIKLFMDVLGVDAAQADIDTCKIEHLISDDTAARATHFLRFIESGRPEATAFLKALRSFTDPCDHDPAHCPCCEDACLAELVEAPIDDD